jgi:hypothetical protein
MLVEILLLILLVAVIVKYGLSDRWRGIVRRAIRPALIVGGIGFAAGFFGPMLLEPDANQGPMLGIFITGPLGFMLGLVYGVIREWRKPKEKPPAPGNPEQPAA